MKNRLSLPRLHLLPAFPVWPLGTSQERAPLSHAGRSVTLIEVSY